MVHGVATATLPPVTPGLAYVLLDGLAVVPDDPSTHPRSNTGAGYTTTAAFRLDAPLVVPVGSQLKESSVAYQAPAPASSPALLIFRQPLDASLQMVGNVLLPESPAQSVATAQLNETVDGTSTYNLQFFVGFTNPTASVFAVRGGYLPPPQAFVPLSPSQRVLDTRVTGGTLNISEERVITLDGVPAFAHGAVINLTVTGGRKAPASWPCSLLARAGLGTRASTGRDRTRASPTACSPVSTPLDESPSAAA